MVFAAQRHTCVCYIDCCPTPLPRPSADFCLLSPSVICALLILECLPQSIVLQMWFCASSECAAVPTFEPDMWMHSLVATCVPCSADLPASFGRDSGCGLAAACCHSYSQCQGLPQRYHVWGPATSYRVCPIGFIVEDYPALLQLCARPANHGPFG